MEQNDRNRIFAEDEQREAGGEGSIFSAVQGQNTGEKQYLTKQAKVMALAITIAFAVFSAAACAVNIMGRNLGSGDGSAQVIAASAVREAPKSGSSPAAFNSLANSEVPVFTGEGKTSYGYNWTYTTDSNCVVIHCDYNYNTESYVFTAHGEKEGTAHVTLQYKENDSKWAAKDMTISVDKNLKISLK